MGEAMLAVDDLSVHYGAIAALENVSITVAEGEIVGIIGPNGAGKSSLMLSIAGCVQPSSGEVHLDGTSLVGKPPEEIVRRGVALVPESRRIFASLTVAENLDLGATTRTDGDAVERDRARVFSLFPILEKYRNTPGGKLSGGEQQQLAIARALLSAPRLLMLDEPTLGLAPLMIDTVFATLGRLRDAGVTVLLVEQNARRTVRLADRSYVLHGGRLRHAGDRAAFTDGTLLEQVYLGR
jgi:branched-chain amino acid transport system ATP-binding protein